MAVVSVFYAAFGYLALLAALLWGMLFLGGSVPFPNMDAAGTAAPLQAAFVDLGLLLLFALLHRSVSRGMLRRFTQRLIPHGLERSTQAWTAAAALALIWAGWQPLPQVLWVADGPLQWALSSLFYLAWTLILIGAFLASHLQMFEITAASDATAPGVAAPGTASQTTSAASLTDRSFHPLYWGVLVAVWATPVMTVGHLLCAAAVTTYLLLDGLWAARRAGSARRSAPHAHSRASASRVNA